MRAVGAVVRKLPGSFRKALSRETFPEPIDVKAAQRSYDDYLGALRERLDFVVEVPADDAHPDCTFVEDTAVVVGNSALVTRIGAGERQGEVDALVPLWRDLKMDVTDMRAVSKTATLDGGDVMNTGRHLFVGLSGRTNERGAAVLEEAFAGASVVRVPLPEGELHLKGLVTHVKGPHLLVADNEAGRALAGSVPWAAFGYETHMVHPQSANVLAFNDSVFCAAGFPHTRTLLQDLVPDVVEIDNREHAKADGALTCRSVLLSVLPPL